MRPSGNFGIFDLGFFLFDPLFVSHCESAELHDELPAVGPFFWPEILISHCEGAEPCEVGPLFSLRNDELLAVSPLCLSHEGAELPAVCPLFLSEILISHCKGAELCEQPAVGPLFSSEAATGELPVVGPLFSSRNDE